MQIVEKKLVEFYEAALINISTSAIFEMTA